MSDVQHAKVTPEVIRQAAETVLGARDVINPEHISWPNLSDEDFDNARKMAASICDKQRQHGFSNGASLEVVAILLAAELFSMASHDLSFAARQQALATVVAKGMLHGQSMIEAAKAGVLQVEEDGNFTAPPAATNSRLH